METNVNYTVVGVFVISLIAAITMTVIWLSAGFSIQHFKTYMIFMNESVSGLTIDSPVEYNGVGVGSVTSVHLNRQNPQVVEVILQIQTGTPITTATIATLKTRGITGITFISLKDENIATTPKPLVAVEGLPYPVIKAGPSLFTRIDTALNQLSENLHDVSQAIRTLLDKENQKSIKDILSNMQTITNELAENSGQMTTILNNTTSATRQLTSLIQSGTGTVRILETQTLPMTYRLLTNLDTMTRNLSSVSAQLKQNPSVIIRGSAPLPLGPGETR
jgi:phospholipid/cholesterol/gamma-HCH transport system substrate-binding protein